VIGVNALGCPDGCDRRLLPPERDDVPPPPARWRGYSGHSGGLMVMLAEFGTMSLKDVLQPSIQMADGYPIEEELARSIERQKDKIKEWPYSKRALLPHLGEKWRLRSRVRFSVSRSSRPRCGSWWMRSSRRWLRQEPQAGDLLCL